MSYLPAGSVPANAVLLLAFVLVALVAGMLWALARRHAREATSWGGQMHDLYEFTRRTLEMNLNSSRGRNWLSWCMRYFRWRP
jgi:hypothetical protein